MSASSCRMRCSASSFCSPLPATQGFWRGCAAYGRAGARRQNGTRCPRKLPQPYTQTRTPAMFRSLNRDTFKRWETLLAAILVVVVVFNTSQSPVFLQTDNLVNLFVLHIEKIIVALAMTLVIINSEI